MGIIDNSKGCSLERKKDTYIYIYFSLGTQVRKNSVHNIHYNRYQLQSKSGGQGKF